MSGSMVEQFTREDRDMLVLTAKTVNDIKNDVKDLKDNLASRVSALESGKAGEMEIKSIYESRNRKWDDFTNRIANLERDKMNCNDGVTAHEEIKKRIGSLEGWRKYIIGISAVSMLLVSLVVAVYLRDAARNKEDLQDIKNNLEKHLDQTNRLNSLK